MSKQTRQTTQNKNSLTKGEDKLIGLISSLIPTGLAWVGHFLLKILRLKWHDRSIQTENGANVVTPMPTGPFVTAREKQLGDLLLWVPRGIDSFLIDEMTGGYGYSHCTVDTGEIDLPTYKPVMVEITIGQKVARKFQDEYDQRPFIRVPISKVGVDVEAFVERVKSKLGEQYDTLGALTLGEIENPAKEVCSRVAADCLPEAERQRIARAKKLRLLRSTSVNVYSKLDGSKTREFISPNGFAEYYGAPKGRKISGPDFTIELKPVEISLMSVAAGSTYHRGWKLAAGAFAILLLAFLLRQVTPESVRIILEEKK